MTSPNRTTGYVLMNIGMLWIATATASVALWPIYHSPWLAVMVGGALAVGTAIAFGGALWRWSPPLVAAATVLGFILTGVAFALPGQALFGVLPTPTALRDLLAGVALGWKQLLTISLPVGTFEALLVPFFALTLLTTVLALSAALRSRIGGIAVLGPVVLWVTALLFGPDAPVLPTLTSLGLFAVILVWMTLRRRYSRRALVLASLELATPGSLQTSSTPTAVPGGAAVRSVLSFMVILLIAGGAATGAGALFAPRVERAVLRTAVEQSFDPRDYSSPLSGFRKYWSAPTDTAVLFTVSGLPANARIRIATLDSYDGIVYSVGSDNVDSASGLFTRVPYTLDQSALGGTEVTVGIDVGSYSAPWLPTVGSLESISFSGVDAAEQRSAFYYNDTSGTAAVLDGLSEGDAYTLTAVLPTQPDADELSTLTPGDAIVPEVTSVPEEISVVVDDYAASADSDGEKLAAVIEGLRTDGYISHGLDDEPASRSGHAADRISELLTDTRMIGDAEQYAVTAALMARELGYPARVVFGFVPADTATAADTATEVLGTDVSAWIEVNTREYGWVTIDPTPEAREIPAEEPQEPTAIARPENIVDQPKEDPAPALSQESAEVEEDDTAEVDPFAGILWAVLQWSGLVLAAIALLLSPFLAIIFAKSRRRTIRSRAPDNLVRIEGAWREFEDSAIDHGYQPPPAATRSEVAALVGGTRATVLAAVTDRAVFAPQSPDAVEADRVWRVVNELTAGLNASATRWDRVKARISLASLGGYSGRIPNKRWGWLK